MSWMIGITIIIGALLGCFVIPPFFLDQMDLIIAWALGILVFTVGMDLGKNKAVLGKIQQIGWKVLLVPLTIALGSIFGAVLGGFFLKLPFHESAAIGSGFGWYSLSAILIDRLYNTETGTIAFLSNVFREIMAIILIPYVAKKLGKITAVAPGGATGMDTTLPFVTKYAGIETGLISFISGIILTALVPLLVPFFIGL